MAAISISGTITTTTTVARTAAGDETISLKVSNNSATNQVVQVNFAGLLLDFDIPAKGANDSFIEIQREPLTVGQTVQIITTTTGDLSWKIGGFSE